MKLKQPLIADKILDMLQSMTPISEPPQLSDTYLENSRWLEANATEVVHDYPNQWVAIFGGRVIVAGPELGAVANKAMDFAPEEDTVLFYADDGSRIFSSPGNTICGRA